MAKTTLQVIQAIEEEAKKIKQIFDDKIQASDEQIKHKLAEDEAVYNSETEQLVEALKEQQEAEISVAENRLEQTIETNRVKLEKALTEKKEELVQQIVKEVVIRYGN